MMMIRKPTRERLTSDVKNSR
uniref:Uncharacterized protein n=1 Tax=Rhizophora mucronata TaxID=61149 RepID=A0A2P2QJW9_RHIMU